MNCRSIPTANSNRRKALKVMFKNPIVQGVLTVIGTLVVLKIVKPYLPAAISNWLP